MDEPQRAELRFTILATVFLWGIGSWIALRQRAVFWFGGDTESFRPHEKATYIDARGWDAIAIAAVWYALGFLAIARVIRGPARAAFFWIGAGLFGAAALYGLRKIVLQMSDVVAQIFGG